MAADFIEGIVEQLPHVATLYHRLVLVVGPDCSGKTFGLRQIAASQGWPRINVNLQLAERLLELTHKQRAARVASILDDIVKEVRGEVILLDNIEMLFAAELFQDPLRLLQNLSRNRTVIAAWPGSYDGQSLLYAEPGHPEFRKYPSPQAMVVTASFDGSHGAVQGKKTK